MWPFARRPERREALDGYTLQLLSGDLATAEGTKNTILGVAALESCARIYADSLAACRVEPAGLARTVTPDVLSLIGRWCVRRGELVFAVEYDDAMMAPRLSVAGDFDVRGGTHVPESWSYRVTHYGPTNTRTRVLPATAACHFMWATDPRRPWRGVSPIANSPATAKLAGELERALGDEAGSPVGSLIPTSDPPEDGFFANLAERIRKSRGKVHLVESPYKVSEDRTTSVRSEWQAHRFGANYPASLPTVRDAVSLSIIQACGISPSMIHETADGTARREGYRQFAYGSLDPFARRIAAELSAKLDTPVTLDTESIHASDTAGRARAALAIVQALAAAAESGVDAEQALKLAGFMADTAD
ncbi:MAG: hypothetical protein OXH15_19430 [Gammaproteobacteria bacterium]|nr:hypothetical protein [Gammaproteobacteria bacterium]